MNNEPLRLWQPPASAATSCGTGRCIRWPKPPRCGIEPGQIAKTIVVRRAEDDYLFVLVPGDHKISWPKLRNLLGVKRLSMPDAATALDVTGYERGTITPFGSLRAWPVIADSRVTGLISLGAGGHGVAATVAADDAIKALGAQVADVTDPQQ